MPTRREPPANRPGDPDVARATTLARWLDDRYLDPLLGLLLPGAGDFLTTGAGLYTVRVALKKGLPRVVVARMLVNLAADAAFGAIPVLGDLFDLVFKANRRNLRLLEARHAGRESRATDWLYVAGAALLLASALALPIVLVALVIAHFA